MFFSLMALSLSSLEGYIVIQVCRGLEYSDELEAFLMSLMPIDPRVSKKLNALSWSYVEGASVKFPVALVSS